SAATTRHARPRSATAVRAVLRAAARRAAEAGAREAARAADAVIPHAVVLVAAVGAARPVHRRRGAEIRHEVAFATVVRRAAAPRATETLLTLRAIAVDIATRHAAPATPSPRTTRPLATAPWQKPSRARNAATDAWTCRRSSTVRHGKRSARKRSSVRHCARGSAASIPRVSPSTITSLASAQRLRLFCETGSLRAIRCTYRPN